MNTADCFATIESRFHDWNYGHPKVLYGFIRAMKPSVVVEVGTYRGYAACYMARAIQENNFGRLYCIDNFSESIQQKFADPVAHWEENLKAAGVRDWATLLRGRSDEVEWPGRVDVAYIDGWHSYTACNADFIRCADRGAELIALDDVNSTVGPMMVADELDEHAWEDWQVVNLHRDCGLAICLRVKPRPPVSFSQELPDNPGVVLKGLSPSAVAEHFRSASKATGVNYDRIRLQ